MIIANVVNRVPLFLKKSVNQPFINFSLIKTKYSFNRAHNDSVYRFCSSRSNFDSHSTSNEKEVIVYKGPLKKRIKYVKFFTIVSNTIALALFPGVIYDISKVSIAASCGTAIISMFFLSTPFWLNLFTKRYVIELTYNRDTQLFSAKTYNIINQIKEIKYKASEVEVPEVPGFLSSYKVHDKPLFVDSSLIEDVEAYSHMMGYDKPLDLKLCENKKDDKNL